jgi:hypothetical protein
LIRDGKTTSLTPNGFVNHILPRNEPVAALYSAYGDESHDETETRTFALAGLFGQESDWDDVSESWFERTNGKDFHAAKCEAWYRGMRDEEHEENLRLYRDLTTILCESRIIGHAIAVSLESFNHYFPNALRGSPYLLCFSHIVFRCGELGKLSIPSGKVKFTFDRNFDHEYNATRLYDHLAKLPEWRDRAYIDREIGFASRQRNAQIQAADLVARETMKRLDGYISGARPARRSSMVALEGSRKFEFRYLHDSEFAHLAKYSDELGKQLKGSKESEYRAWLAKYRLQDNHDNRMSYMIYLDRINETPAKTLAS